MYISPNITDAFTVDDGCEVLAQHRSVWYQYMKVTVSKSECIWPLCIQKEDVNLLSSTTLSLYKIGRF